MSLLLQSSQFWDFDGCSSYLIMTWLIFSIFIGQLMSQALSLENRQCVSPRDPLSTMSASSAGLSENRSTFDEKFYFNFFFEHPQQVVALASSELMCWANPLTTWQVVVLFCYILSRLSLHQIFRFFKLCLNSPMMVIFITDPDSQFFTNYFSRM